MWSWEKLRVNSLFAQPECSLFYFKRFKLQFWKHSFLTVSRLHLSTASIRQHINIAHLLSLSGTFTDRESCDREFWGVWDSNFPSLNTGATQVLKKYFKKFQIYCSVSHVLAMFGPIVYLCSTPHINYISYIILPRTYNKNTPEGFEVAQIMFASQRNRTYSNVAAKFLGLQLIAPWVHQINCRSYLEKSLI